MKDMNFNYIVTTFMEECAELTQILSKCMRFGMDSKNPHTGKVNTELLIDEFHDVMACFKLLSLYLDEHHRIDISKLDEEKITRKISRMKKYFKESRLNDNFYYKHATK